MRALACLLIAAAAAAHAQDESALSLADKTVTTEERPSDWRVFIEAAAAHADLRSGGAAASGQRLSLDLRYDTRVAADWRAVLSNRLDLRWQQSPSANDQVNTLKELYASWQPRPDRIVDLGRINARQGMAYGYNPTDWFRAGAVRSVSSIDPASLRENRLGAVMLRGQALWTSMSLTAQYSPELADRPSSGAFNPDLGATNRRDRWLLAASVKFTEQLNPQVLLYREAGRAPQFGLNVTTLLGKAAVGYVEWAGGRSLSIAAQALAMPDDSAFRSRLAVGLAYTTPNNLTLTAEYQYNGAGLDRAGWAALRQGPPETYAAVRAFAADVQDPPTRRRVFLRAFWQDALIRHFDLTANVFVDPVDSSRQSWLEARYHWTRFDLALQWQINQGRPGSEYGALAQRQVWQALVALFF